MSGEGSNSPRWCGDPSLNGGYSRHPRARMPEFQPSVKLRFSVRLCPTIHVTPGKEGTTRAE
jgi:hypothetical protein